MWHRIRRIKGLGFLAKAGLTAAAFAFALKDVDLAHLAEIARRQEMSGILLAAGLVSAQIVLGALRWGLIVRALSGAGKKALGALEALRLYYISVFFNCCLPGTIGGDVVRAWLAKSEHISLEVSIHSVIIDRIIALLALALLVVAALPLFAKVFELSVPLWTTVSIFVLIAGVLALRFARRLLMPYAGVRWIGWIVRLLEGIRTLARRPAIGIGALSYAFLAHVCYCLCAVALAGSMGMAFSVTQALAVIPPVLLITTLPISIGGWGVREASMVGFMALIGIAQEPAIMLSVEMGLISILLSLPAGLLWLAHRHAGGGSHASH